MNTTKLNFGVDVIIGIAFALALASGLTAQSVHGRIELHIFAGLSLSIGVVAHLILHRKWIAMALRPGKKPGQLVINIWLNLLLGVTFVLTLISGLHGHRNPSDIDPLHASAVTGMAIVLLVHLVRHWKWVMVTARRY